MTFTDKNKQGLARDITSVQCLDITVLAGGPGLEREVSLDSGQAVFEALTRLGHRATLCDINPNDLSALDRHADMVFIALHGEFGEDGALQAELDTRGIRYTGSGAAASGLAMDKAASKRAFEAAGIATPPYEVVNASNIDTLTARFHAPAVVKPVASGSSVDTTIARDDKALMRDANTLIEKSGQAMVERYIDGPELTVGILADDALPVCEIRTKREFYDYNAKYVDDDTEYLFDPAVPDKLMEQVQAMSLVAHRALGCRSFSRVDWMIDKETMQPYALEINTIPGFTGHSLLPKSAARVGIGFDELCQRIVVLALACDPTETS